MEIYLSVRSQYVRHICQSTCSTGLDIPLNPPPPPPKKKKRANRRYKTKSESYTFVASKIGLSDYVILPVNLKTYCHKNGEFFNPMYLCTSLLQSSNKLFSCTKSAGRDSVLGIAINYGVNGDRIESRWGKIFRTRS